MSIIEFMCTSIFEFMGSSRFFFLIPVGIALILFFCTTGRKKWIACGILVSTLLGPVVVISDYTVLKAQGLTWQKWFTLLSVSMFFWGEIASLVWAGTFLWKLAANLEIFVRWVCRSAVLSVIGLFCYVALLLGVLFLGSALDGLDGRVEEINGQKVIWVYVQRDYYAYYGPFIRGNVRLELEQFEVETNEKRN